MPRGGGGQWLPTPASMMLSLMTILDPAHAPPAHARELRPPVAARRPVVAEHHGVQHSDDYGWLRRWLARCGTVGELTQNVYRIHCRHWASDHPCTRAA